MGVGHWGSKEYVEEKKNNSILKDVNLKMAAQVVQTHDDLALRNRILELEHALENKEVHYEKVVQYEQVEVIKEVEKIVEKEVQVVTNFPVIKERIVTEYVDKPFEVIKEVEKLVEREIKVVPLWAYCGLLVQTLAIIVLLLK